MGGSTVAPAADQANAHDPQQYDAIELPEWLEKRLARATPNTGNVFELPAEDADLQQWEAWPIHGGEFPVWPENRAIVELFLACHTQWTFAGMDGARVGLNYLSVALVAFAMKQPPITKGTRFEELHTMESAALFAYQQQRARDAALKA